MAATKAVWGLDLGQCALKAIRIRAAGDKVEALDYAYIEHEKILSQPEVNRQQIIADTMRKFVEAHDLSRERIMVAVPGQNTLARFIKLPPVEKVSKIPDLVAYEARQQIPFDMEEVIWDYQTFKGEEAGEMEVGIFAMRRDLMREHLRYLADFNLEPASVQAAPLALYNALHYEGLCGEQVVAILDIGTQNTDLLIADSKSLWTRNIPLGGNEFTNTLVKNFKMPFDKAEKLKRSAGSHKYARQIFQAMRPVFADLVAEVQRSIGFYTSARRGVKISKLIAMGNAFRLPGLPKFVQQTLDLDVDRPTGFNKLSAGSTPNAPQLLEQLLSFGVAYGLALQGLDKAVITSNLLPPELAKQVIWRRKTPWFYGAAACLAAAAGTVWMVNLSDHRVLTNATGQGMPAPPVPADVQQASAIVAKGPDPNLPPKFYAQQILDAARVLDSKKSEVRQANDQVVTKAKEIEELQSNKPLWPRILEMIHSAVPAKDAELTKAMAAGPEAYKTLIDSNPTKYERPKREQVFIQKLSASYAPDVFASWESAKVAEGSTGGGGSQTGDAAPQETSKPGFLIRLVARTPYAGGDQMKVTPFISDRFIGNLRKTGITQQGVYLDKFDLLRCVPVSTVRGPAPAGGAAPGVGKASPFAGLGTTGMATIADPRAGKDPVTGESISNDWEFELLFVAVIGDRPETPPSEDTANAEPAQSGG